MPGLVPVAGISPLAGKLLIKPSMTMRLFDAPAGYQASLAPLPEAASLDTQAGAHDFVQLFALDSAALASKLPEALAALEHGGLFWISFPKSSSNVQTDLSRDKGWGSLHALGYRLVSLVSIDETWSAARIRPIKD